MSTSIRGCFWINDPILRHTCRFISIAFHSEIAAGGAGGQDFNDQIRDPFDDLVADPICVLPENHDEIGLQDIFVTEPYPFSNTADKPRCS